MLSTMRRRNPYPSNGGALLPQMHQQCNYFQYPSSYQMLPPPQQYPTTGFNNYNHGFVHSPGLKEVVTSFFPGASVSHVEPKRRNRRYCTAMRIILVLLALVGVLIVAAWFRNGIAISDPVQEAGTTRPLDGFENVITQDELRIIVNRVTPNLLRESEDITFKEVQPQDDVVIQDDTTVSVVFSKDDDAETLLESYFDY